MPEDIFPNVEYLVYRQTYPNWCIPERTIDNHELVFITKGKGQITIENKKFEVDQNTLIYFYPGQRHSLTACGLPCMSFYGVHFTFNNDMDKLPLPDMMKIQNPIKLKTFFDSLHQVWNEKLYLYSWKQNIILQEILYDIFTNSHYYINPIKEKRIDKVLEHIHAHPCSQFTIAELSALAGIQKSLFIKSFREITGQTPVKYTTLLKLDHAKKLLLSSTLTVSDVAYRCGFNDPFYFSRMFKNTYGVSPKTWREHVYS